MTTAEIDRLCAQASARISQYIARSAAQQLRRWRQKLSAA